MHTESSVGRGEQIFEMKHTSRFNIERDHNSCTLGCRSNISCDSYLVVAVNVQAEAQCVHSLVVGTLGGVAVTVTWLALKLVIRCVSIYLVFSKIFVF